MKKNSQIIAIVLLSFVLSYCTKDSKVEIDDKTTKNKVAIFKDYFDFMNTETNGSILIQSYKTPLSEESFAAISDIDGNRQPLALKVNDRLISFTNYEYSETTNKSSSNIDLDNMASVYGNFFSVELGSTQVKAKSTNNTTSSTNTNNSVYIPQLIKAKFDDLENGKIVAGSKISWNFDDNNEKGVVILLEYDPYSQLNAEIVSQKPERYIKGITVAEGKSYVVSADDLNGFVSGAMLTFYLGRAGYSIATDNDGNDYSLAAYTMSMTDLDIKK